MMTMKIKFLTLVLAMVLLLPGLSLAGYYDQHYTVDYNVTYDETYMYAFMPGIEAHFGGYDAIDNMIFIQPKSAYYTDTFRVLPVHLYNETMSSIYRKATIYALIFLGGDYGDGS